MVPAFLLLLAVVVRSCGAPSPFFSSHCQALRARHRTPAGAYPGVPSVNDLLDRLAVRHATWSSNLHAALNILGGLLVILLGLVLPRFCDAAGSSCSSQRSRPPSFVLHLGNRRFPAVESPRVAGGASLQHAVARLERGRLSLRYRLRRRSSRAFWGMQLLRVRPRRRSARRGQSCAPPACPALHGKDPHRVRASKPCALAGYGSPLGLMGFPARLAVRPLPVHSVRSSCSPVRAHLAGLSRLAFSRTSEGPLRTIGGSRARVAPALGASLERRAFLTVPTRAVDGFARPRRPAVHRRRVRNARGIRPATTRRAVAVA